MSLTDGTNGGITLGRFRSDGTKMPSDKEGVVYSKHRATGKAFVSTKLPQPIAAYDRDDGYVTQYYASALLPKRDGKICVLNHGHCTYEYLSVSDLFGPFECAYVTSNGFGSFELVKIHDDQIEKLDLFVWHTQLDELNNTGITVMYQMTD